MHAYVGANLVPIAVPDVQYIYMLWFTGTSNV